MFSGLLPEEELRPVLAQTVVCHAQIDAVQRSIEARIRSEEYIPLRQLHSLEHALCRTYGLRSVILKPEYAPELLVSMDLPELIYILAEQNPAANAILAGAALEFGENSISIQLAANGVKELSVPLRAAEELLSEWFCTKIVLHVTAGKALTEQELYAETERLRQEAIAAIPPALASEPKPSKPQEEALFGRPFRNKTVPMRDITIDSGLVCVEGEVFAVRHRDIPKNKACVVSFFMTDQTGSVWVSKYMKAAEAAPIIEALKARDAKKHKQGSYVRVLGRTALDKFEGNALILSPNAIMFAERPTRCDTAPQKRVELHLHTKMSAMDALTDPVLAIRQAAAWGHRAIAITDHGVAHAFPDAMHAASEKVAGTGEKIKVLYGCEGYFINDVDPCEPSHSEQPEKRRERHPERNRLAVTGKGDAPLSGEFIAFDLETTGLNADYDRIIEIGAVKMRGDTVLDRFSTFVDPERELSTQITELTGITDEMLVGAPKPEQAIPAFLRFCGDLPLVAHNASFDVGFVKAVCRKVRRTFQNTVADTYTLAQSLLPQLTKYKLNVLAEYLGLPDFNHHRATDDAITCGMLYVRFAEMLEKHGVHSLMDVNDALQSKSFGSIASDKKQKNHHIILLAKNSLGLRNLYRLISYSNLYYFKTVPRIPKSELQKWREGILIGSACEAGELFRAIVDGHPWEELLQIATFYDFLEIQPLSNNRFLVEKGIADSDETLREYNRTVVRIGEALQKLVVATGDVHFLEPNEEEQRHILLAAKEFEDYNRPNPLYFRTTDEMLEEFSYLGEKTAFDVVVRNTNRIADMCERLQPVPNKLFAPKIEHSVEDLKSLVYGKMTALYGENPPELIRTRVETELHDIINSHYDVIYMSAQKLVQHSLENGYLVGSRGSVGSSIVAYLSGITEVNAFPPHYRCPNPACKYTTFEVPEGIACGADLPDDICPHCGTAFAKEGFKIPFETFLGFGGKKVPDIDLNFSGEFQAKAHAYCMELFGKSHVFRAGTIGGIQDKTAYGYAKKFLEAEGRTAGRAEEERLANYITGVKRTTSQHPGGLVVIPQENEIWDFCPVQHPADDANSEWITTHFEYHSMEDNLLKLDMLGHDDPTMIRMLQDLTGVDPQTIPLDDKETMSIFVSSEVLGYKDDPVLGQTGAVGIPEFGTRFTRGMLVDTQPKRFDTLLRLSGFSHGTDVWNGNAKDLILSGTATVDQAIGCRDDIMNYLIGCGLPELHAFDIMEKVRKGKGLSEAYEKEMRTAGVPDWYIASCQKIKYLFPKAHAVAYVMMAFRIAWFKVHYPLAYYAAYFYRRSQKGGFDAALMCSGKEAVLKNIEEIRGSGDATDKDNDNLTTLEVCYEYYLRGYSFAPISLYKSDAVKFIQIGDQLLPPFIAVAGLGETAARDIVEGRKGKRFISIEAFSAACPKVSQTHIGYLKAAGAFGDLPDKSQVSLFDI